MGGGTRGGPAAAPGPGPPPPGPGSRLQPADTADPTPPRSRPTLPPPPHTPPGPILPADDLRAIGELAIKHDLWIISDEVYEHLVFEGAEFVSPLSDPALADRVIAVSSISK
ncbi:aminotransferase class I/II-fold pyridoxal phosphate-dependent enzyme, partial [Leisingera sp. ANG-M1]|uniref:aminotransferase class I/II-fold pyridoxal phosphate-dependent enzyme n=1 Tax=Leisingera sp. ANG-M1 TaxID=1577895 RepID=UPI001F4CFC8B